MTELQKKMVEKLGLSQEDFQPKKATKVDELEAQYEEITGQTYESEEQ